MAVPSIANKHRDYKNPFGLPSKSGYKGGAKTAEGRGTNRKKQGKSRENLGFV